MGPARPARTCVGCRVTTAKTDLLRLVAVDGVLLPDTRARQPGRGAYLHPTATCLDLAQRRRAFPRALRLAGPLDDTPVRAHLEQHDTARPTAPTVNGSGSHR